VFIPLVSFGQSETENNLEVPINVTDNVPVYPGCKGSELKKRKCMSDKIAHFVVINFKTKIAERRGLTGRQRINVIFKIDKSGYVTDVRARASHPSLEQEAVRVVNLLPKMEPGLENGKPVIVPYSLPIIFQIRENANKEEMPPKKSYKNWLPNID
tara:strand:- start:324 stop:791 length:468 start_codon:yes stop_codon:yes gene_type:complete